MNFWLEFEGETGKVNCLFVGGHSLLPIDPVLEDHGVVMVAEATAANFVRAVMTVGIRPPNSQDTAPFVDVELGRRIQTALNRADTAALTALIIDWRRASERGRRSSRIWAIVFMVLLSILSWTLGQLMPNLLDKLADWQAKHDEDTALRMLDELKAEAEKKEFYAPINKRHNRLDDQIQELYPVELDGNAKQLGADFPQKAEQLRQDIRDLKRMVEAELARLDGLEATYKNKIPSRWKERTSFSLETRRRGMEFFLRRIESYERTVTKVLELHRVGK